MKTKWRGFLIESWSYMQPIGLIEFLWKLPRAWARFTWLELGFDVR